jgi:very-short-patch-repair endonuclease
MPSQRARELRARLTEAERHLWYALRRKQLRGHRFRRQVPLGPYVADFACLAQRLVIEVDGGQHGDEAERDARRTAWLEAQGFHVLQFWNNDVLGNIEGVLEVIARQLASGSPPPQPSPARGEGESGVPR